MVGFFAPSTFFFLAASRGLADTVCTCDTATQPIATTLSIYLTLVHLLTAVASLCSVDVAKRGRQLATSPTPTRPSLSQ